MPRPYVYTERCMQPSEGLTEIFISIIIFTTDLLKGFTITLRVYPRSYSC